MLTKNKYAIVIMTTLSLLILFSNITVSLPVNFSNQNVAPVGLNIVDHKITLEELDALTSHELTQNSQTVDGYGTGFNSPTSQDLAQIAENARVIDSISIENVSSFVDNSATPWFPPIGNQGKEGSCVAWSVAYYVKTYMEAKEHMWDLSDAKWESGAYSQPTASYQNKIMSPEFVYQLINSGVDRGATFEQAIDLVASIGVCSWSTLPYDPLDSISWPIEAAWAEAPLYRSSSNPTYQYIYADTQEGLTSLKNWLAAGNLAVIALDANQYENLTKNDLLDQYFFDNKELNHANVIVGYDDNYAYTVNGEQHFGAFKLANSWGTGTWEKVSDGYYWISYDAMKQLSNQENPCVIFNDLINYQPELTVSFQIEHARRGECAITLGCGNPTDPIAQKVFSDAVLGGNRPFCSNNIIVDVTEFKQNMTSFYNLPFFLTVYDNGTRTTGKILYFAVEDAVSQDTPKLTQQLQTVAVNVNYSLSHPVFTVSPDYGAAGTKLTLQGTDFTPNSTVNLLYLNPVSGVWNKIAGNVPVSETQEFSFTVNAPDLGVGNPAGDTAQLFDNIVFAAQDNGNGYSFNLSVPFKEYKKGLTSINGLTAQGLFGNNTDLSGVVYVQAGQPIIVCGKNFNQGSLTAFYDGVYSMGSVNVDESGVFNASFTVPSQGDYGEHFVTFGGVGDGFRFTLTQMPKILTDYDGNWHSTGFVVNLSVDGEDVSEIYYKVNNGETRSVNIDGQPLFTVEGVNTLEYWGTWSSGNQTTELIHNTVEVKLDNTAPSGTLKIDNGAEFCVNNKVTLSLTGQDGLSGVTKMRFSNDGTWATSAWEPYSSSKTWTLTGGDGVKTVYCQVMDAAGLTVDFEDQIVLDTTKPSIEAIVNQAVTAGVNTEFVANCSDQNGVASIVWSFGDDSATVEGSKVNHVYDEAGNYAVTVKAFDAAGNVAQTTVNMTVTSASQSSPSPNGSNQKNPPLEFPTETVVVIAVLLVAACLVFMLVRFKQRKVGN